MYAWDIWLLDLKSGKEKLLVKNGNVPTWSADGKAVYFQRNAIQVVKIEVKTSKERIIYQSGKNIKLPPKTELQTPNISSNGRLAVTFRKSMRATAVVSPDGKVQKIGNGCQLIWAPADDYLVKVDDGGRGGNTFYKIDPKTLVPEKWFDAREPYSHEYFSKIANSGDTLVYGASSGGHEHDSADYEIFLWPIGTPESEVIRLTFHTGNDCWPDLYLNK